MNLSAETIATIDRTIPRFPQKRSALLPVIHAIQADQGYVSNEAIEWIAERLDVQPINVYELVTFYPYFREKPFGKHHVRVCRTLSCALCGGYRIAEKLEDALKCKLGHTSDDGQVTLEFAECLASCGTGPVVMVDEQLFENVDDSVIQQIADLVSAPSETREEVEEDTATPAGVDESEPVSQPKMEKAKAKEPGDLVEGDPVTRDHEPGMASKNEEDPSKRDN